MRNKKAKRNQRSCKVILCPGGMPFYSKWQAGLKSHGPPLRIGWETWAHACFQSFTTQQPVILSKPNQITLLLRVKAHILTEGYEALQDPSCDLHAGSSSLLTPLKPRRPTSPQTHQAPPGFNAYGALCLEYSSANVCLAYLLNPSSSAGLNPPYLPSLLYFPPYHFHHLTYLHIFLIVYRPH